MKYVIIPILLILNLFLVPVGAREISSDTFIVEYEPMKIFSTHSKYIPQDAKRRVPADQSEPEHSPVLPAENNLQTYEKVQIKSFIIPEIMFYIATKGKKMLNTFYLTYLRTISSLTTRVSNLSGKEEVKGVTQKNSEKITPTKKQVFTAMPSLQAVKGLHSRFSGDPYSDEVQAKVKEVYTWDRLWNPAYNPQAYLQCTTYVAMIYNLNGISLHGKVAGDAREWIRFSETFDIFENGNTTMMPMVMDIAVWAENGDNHVGVISVVTDSTVTIMNSNAEQTSYTYTLEVNDEGIVSLSGTTTWVPSHWMRIKP